MKRHTKQHVNIDAIDEEYKHAKLQRCKKAFKRCEQQWEATRTIAEEIGVPSSCYEHSAQNSLIEHSDDFCTRLQNNKRMHAEKTRLGQEIVPDGDTSKESPSKDDKMFEKLKKPSAWEVLCVCVV